MNTGKMKQAGVLSTNQKIEWRTNRTRGRDEIKANREKQRALFKMLIVKCGKN